MINSIINILGPNWREIKLYDDNSLSTGGISRAEETLEEFMAECEISPFESIGKLQKTLKDCGILPIEIADKKIEDIIKEEIENIEDELGIVIDFTWDYYECINELL